jgi:hypothetical protein
MPKRYHFLEKKRKKIAPKQKIDKTRGKKSIFLRNFRENCYLLQRNKERNVLLFERNSNVRQPPRPNFAHFTLPFRACM